jgi:hypothetical protein
MTTRRKLIAAIGVAALAIPTVALAKPHGDHGGGKGHNPSVSFNFKGTYAGDGTTVHVTHGNGHAKRAGLVGQDATFDFSSAKIEVADTNADTLSDLSDVLTDDSVVVKAKLPMRDAVTQPIAARQLVDQTNSSDEDDDDSADEGEDAPDEGEDG